MDLRRDTSLMDLISRDIVNIFSGLRGLTSGNFLIEREHHIKLPDDEIVIAEDDLVKRVIYSISASILPGSFEIGISISGSLVGSDECKRDDKL